MLEITTTQRLEDRVILGNKKGALAVMLRGVGAFDCPTCMIRAMKDLIRKFGPDLAQDLWIKALSEL